MNHKERHFYFLSRGFLEVQKNLFLFFEKTEKISDFCGLLHFDFYLKNQQTMYTILIGSDHAGYELKEVLKKKLQAEGFEVKDYGTHSTESMDYPDVAHPLAHDVQTGKAERAILICGSGNGVSMTANKYPAVRAALCWNPELASLARQHNNANILTLPARFIPVEVAEQCVDAFLHTAFEGGRHARRVEKISADLKID